MSQSSRVRDAAELPEQQQRYPGGDARHPTDISDPATTTDETRSTIRSWVHSHPYLATILLLSVPVLIAITLVLVTRVAPGVLGNPWVQRGAIVAGIVGTTAYVSRSDQRRQIEHIDQLELPGGDGLQTYKGRYSTTPDGDLRFTPIKGYTRLGRPSEPYTVEELSQSLAQRYEAAGRDPDDPAHILLHEEFTYVNRTDYGTSVVQLTDGLVVEPFAEHAALRASKPSVADESALRDATQTIDSLEDEVKEKEGTITRLRRQKRDAEQEAKKRREEIIDEFLDKFQDAAEGKRAMSHGLQLDEFGDVGPEPLENGESLDEIEDMYLDDD